MNDDYLWDRTGDRDPEIANLEDLLGSLCHAHRALALPTAVPVRPDTGPVSWRGRWTLLGLAATILFIVGGTWMGLLSGPGTWIVEPTQGTPTYGAVSVRGGVRLQAGRWLETDRTSRARVSAGEVGMVEIGPGTRLRLVKTRAAEHRLVLERGSLHATIWASPGQFYVDTPSATAVDLGCAYSLEVNSSGAGRLRVISGWVGFEQHGKESRVPAGAACTTRPGLGPGTPHFEDASPALVDALATLDSGSASGRAAAIDVLLAEARRQDALTLWHLLTRLDRDSARRVYDRLAALAPPPPGAGREQILDGDRAALDEWWDSLGLGDATRFRRWKLRSF